MLTEEAVYSIIISGDLSREVTLNVIRSYGNRRAIEALEQAKSLIPEAENCIEELEAETLFNACLRKLDQLITASVEAVRETN